MREGNKFLIDKNFAMGWLISLNDRIYVRKIIFRRFIIENGLNNVEVLL